ncbi:Dmx-Like Protein 1 [Manis pentadactyla]|nr:Dmx-Like Protein 1 [Manis pentadactyla]
MNRTLRLTAAVNPGDRCFSVGSVGDQRFNDIAGYTARGAGQRAPTWQPRGHASPAAILEAGTRRAYHI